MLLEELAAARPDAALRPKQWLGEIQRLRLMRHHLDGRTERSRQTWVGQMLHTCVGREVMVEEPETGAITVYRLHRERDRDGCLYRFVVESSPGGPAAEPQADEVPQMAMEGSAESVPGA